MPAGQPGRRLPAREAQALHCLGQSHRALGAYPAAADAYRQAVTISTDLGDRLTATHAACWLGDVLVRQGEHHTGRRLLAQSLWAYREFGILWGEAATLYALAEEQLTADRPALARRRAETAVRLWRQIGSHTWLAVALDPPPLPGPTTRPRSCGGPERASGVRLHSPGFTTS